MQKRKRTSRPKGWKEKDGTKKRLTGKNRWYPFSLYFNTTLCSTGAKSAEVRGDCTASGPGFVCTCTTHLPIAPCCHTRTFTAG